MSIFPLLRDMLLYVHTELLNLIQPSCYVFAREVFASLVEVSMTSFILLFSFPSMKGFHEQYRASEASSSLEKKKQMKITVISCNSARPCTASVAYKAMFCLFIYWYIHFLVIHVTCKQKYNDIMYMQWYKILGLILQLIVKKL